MGDSNFTVGEMKLISTALLAVIIVQGIVLGTGIVDSVDKTDPPTLEIESNPVIQAGDLPDKPGGPSRGVVSTFRNDTYEGTIELGNDTYLRLADFSPTVNGSNISLDDTKQAGVESWFNFTQEGQTGGVSGGGFTINLEVQKIQNNNASVNNGLDYARVEYVITEQPEDTSWIDRIPIVGGIFSKAEQLASIIGWIGSILYWFSLLLLEFFLTIIDYLAALGIFFFSFFTFMIDRWVAITELLANANFFLAFLVIAAQTPLYLILFNGVMKVLKVLPTT